MQATSLYHQRAPHTSTRTMRENEATERRVFLEKLLREDEDLVELLKEEPEEVQHAVLASCDLGLRLALHKYRATPEVLFERDFFGFYGKLKESVYNRLMNNPTVRQYWLRFPQIGEADCETIAYRVSEAYGHHATTKDLPNIPFEALCRICREDPLLPHFDMANENK